MNEMALERALSIAKKRLGLSEAIEGTFNGTGGGSRRGQEDRSQAADRQISHSSSKELPVEALDALSTREKLQTLLASNPTEELVRSVDLVKKVFPEAEILGLDDTDWEAHRKRIQAWEASKKPGCWNCGGLQFWTWLGGVIRCARCHPPVPPDGVVWLDAQTP